MAAIKTFYRKLTRRKYIDSTALLEGSNLKRALTTFDLTALGVGSTLGVGVYVLAGSVSKTTAGPAVVISFLIAAIASAFAGICYAEFGARVPKAGSAYIYSYVCVGEFVGFIIGWNLILEYMVGAASVVRGLSGYVDNLAGGVMAKAFRDIAPMDSDFLSPYPDFFAFGLTMVFTLALAFGVRESSTFHNVFTAINVTVVCYVIICGIFKADIANWTIDKEDIPPEYANVAGEGGFAPFGVSGIVAGAATCFYGFVGFDCVASTGEEAKNPQKSIPIAIVIALTIVFLAYFGVSSVVTLMWPYYLQDPDAPLPHVFEEIGWFVAAWIVSIGALFGMCASFMGALFPLPRVIYAMAKDGIIFRFLATVHPRFQTPVIGTFVAGICTGLLAGIFDLKQLVDMMSIGTLLAYSIVAACVMLLRYQPAGTDEIDHAKELAQDVSVWKQLLNFQRLKSPSDLSGNIVTWGVLVFSIMIVAFAAVIRFAGDDLGTKQPYAIALASIFGFASLFSLLVIGIQPSSKKELFFKVPLVPAIPGVSIFMNIYLMLTLDGQTWLRYLGWMAVGFLIYFCYGIWNSDENKNPSKPESNNDNNNSQKSTLRADRLNGYDNKAYDSNIYDFDTNFTKL